MAKSKAERRRIWVDTDAGLAFDFFSGPTWIPVSVEAPEPGQSVVYYSPQVGSWVGKYDGKGKFGHKFSSFAGYMEGDVTHWFPMPVVPDRVPKAERVKSRIVP